MSDYLFDKEGPPDPEIEQLEQLLAPLAYRERAFTRRRRSRAPWIAGLVAAAAVLVIVLRPSVKPPVAPSGWPLEVLSGTATIDHRVALAKETLAVGAWIETGAGRARIVVPGLGTVELGPGTRARIGTSAAMLSEMELTSGRLTALITAPPRRFAVRTPHDLIVDLGCAFTIELDENGWGHVLVTEGEVAVGAATGRETRLKRGERCELTEAGLVPTPKVAARPAPDEHPSHHAEHAHAMDVPLPGHTPSAPGDDVGPPAYSPLSPTHGSFRPEK